MAAFKFTIGRGQVKKDVVVAAGTVLGADQMSVNIDQTAMTRAEALKGLAEIKRTIIESKWPPL